MYVCMHAQMHPSTESLVGYVAVLGVEDCQPCIKRSWLKGLRVFIAEYRFLFIMLRMH